MRYMGGKHRQSKAILEVLSSRHKTGHYIEPFAGALGSASKVVPHFKSATLSDSSQAVVTLWNEMLNGWVPPDNVSEDLYRTYANKRHHADMFDPMSAWCGYALSFGGKWYGGYARQSANLSGGTTERMQMVQKESAMRKVALIKEYVPRLECLDYGCVIDAAPQGSVIYMDPPYAQGTTAHHTAKGFDHAEFWSRAEALSGRCHVYVSEFKAPEGWEAVHVWGDTVVKHMNAGPSGVKSEALYTFGGRK